MPDTVESTNWQNVIENWMVFDTVRIGNSVSDKYPGGQASFKTLALEDEVSFLNIRNVSEAGRQYTNMEKKGVFPWPFKLESIGIRFIMPTPTVYAAEVSPAINEAYKGKLWSQDIMEDAVLYLSISEDTILKIKPAMLPAGFGPTGDMTALANSNPANTITNGVTYLRNRFGYGKHPIKIPRETVVKAALHFSERGKELLTAMDEVGLLQFGSSVAPVSIENEAKIELTLRGRRAVQQRGELHYSA